MDKHRQLDELFRKAKDEQAHYSFGETRDQFLNSLSTPSGGSGIRIMKFSRTKKWLIMIATVSSIALVVYLFNSNPTTTFEKEIPSKDAFEKQEKSQEIQAVKEENQPEQKPRIANIQRFNVDQEFVIEQLDIVVVAEDTASLYTNVDRQNANPVSLDDYIFPKLTEAEIAANHKQKKQMLKALEKFDRKVYTFLVSGKVDVDGKTTSVQAFIIQKTEVTNLEYRTFLFDLLIQGKKEEFLQAKPDQAMWTKLLGDDNKPMEELYFSHGAYNEYPVVNISREGAELYCKWLTDEIQNFVDEKKRSQFNNIRIPTRVEWVKAAQIEGKSNPYPWEGEFVRNSKGCYLANFKPTDTTYFDDGGLFTVKVNSYLPNDFGIFNMSGNVAEMVYDEVQTKSPGTAGGGWMSSAEEIKILGPDPHKGLTEAHPNVGFRVVMTYLNWDKN
jgi:formylglycine-generating enzyme required for sulfatase activity